MRLPAVLPPVKLLIREHREARGWSQDELATKTGMSRPMVQWKESGAGHCRFVDLQRFAQAFQCRIDELYEGEWPPEEEEPADGQ